MFESIVAGKTAYLSNEDSEEIRNPIHSTAGGQRFGFAGALVGGVTVYGWASELIACALGEQWMDEGWAELTFKRPVYPGDSLTIQLEPDEGNVHRLAITGSDGAARVVGAVGLGNAVWHSELAGPERPLSQPVDEVEPRRLTLESAPVGERLLTLPMDMDVESARSYAVEKQHSTDERFIGASPRLHPAMVASFPIWMIYGQFSFSPGVHVSSQIQHLRRADAQPGFSGTGKMIDVFEKSGRHYCVVDCSLMRNEVEYARIRQTAIFALPS